MAAINKPTDLNRMWAASGDVAKPSDDKILTGWEVEVPPRQWFNWLDNRQDTALAHINQFGIPVWDSATEYQSGRSYTQGPTTGTLYRCTQTHVNQNPETDFSNTYWEVFTSGGGGGGTGNVPAGAVIYRASNSVPDGYLKANGAEVSRATYADLFSAIGTLYGAGDGSTTFNLPDLRGEFIRGFDDGKGVDVGRIFGSSQTDSIKSHTHTAVAENAGEHTHTGSTAASGGHSHSFSYYRTTPTGASGAATGSGFTNTLSSSTTASAGNHTHTMNLDVAGSHNHPVTVEPTGGAETRPRNMAMLALIKY